MTHDDLEAAREAIAELNESRLRNPSRIEVALDSLASALVPLASKKPDSSDLADVLESLDMNAKTRKSLEEIYDELPSALESKGYGDEDEEDEEILEGLLDDFCTELERMVDTLEDRVDNNEEEYGGE